MKGLDCRVRVKPRCADWLVVATKTTYKVPIDVTASIAPTPHSGNPRRRSAAKTSKAERRANIAARPFARQCAASMPFTGRLFVHFAKN